MLLIKVIVFQRTLLPRALRVHGSTHGQRLRTAADVSDCAQLKVFCEEDAGDPAIGCNSKIQ